MPSRFKERFLLFRIRAKKDADAFGEIYDAYVKQLHRFIFFKVASSELAEDLTSETFLKAWQYLKEKRDVPHLQALLYSIARTTVIDHYRKLATRAADVSFDDRIGDDDDIADTGAHLETKLDAKLDVDAMSAALKLLKDEYREVLVMKFMDEMTPREIADILGKTAANVRLLIHRATKALTEVITHEQSVAKSVPDTQK